MGIKGGPTFNSFIVENGSNKYSRVGFQLGLLSQIELTDHIYIQPELLFITKGTEAKIENRFTTNTYEIFLNYISVPISFCYTFKPLHIRGGAYFSYLVGSQAERYNERTNAFQDISREPEHYRYWLYFWNRLPI
ncbi:porin family protein [Fulvivirga ligni]|uniref:porin family protein n=1 Tax=Fulvivirga ligni TaxID=2904246 RepID=UPI001F4708D9|nr:porin family protein [Fulvivirga ligni]UII20041.1 PorT family protein [Fulvivirga ligni]